MFLDLFLWQDWLQSCLLYLLRGVFLRLLNRRFVGGIEVL